MVRIVLSLLIGAHGIGHILFLVPLLGIADWGQSNRSWLLTNESVARFAGSLLWIVAIAGFCAAISNDTERREWRDGEEDFAPIVEVLDPAQKRRMAIIQRGERAGDGNPQ